MESYSKVGWRDYPRTDTPITADNLNHMDEGIEAATEELIKLINGIVHAAIADRLGTTTKGSSVKPIYLNNGNPQECSPATAIRSGDSGIVTGAAVYAALTGGKATKVGTVDVGNATKPVYLKAGVPTACDRAIQKVTRYGYTLNSFTNGTSTNFSIAAGDTITVNASAVISGKLQIMGVRKVWVTNTAQVIITAFDIDDTYDSSKNRTSLTGTIRMWNKGSSAVALGPGNSKPIVMELEGLIIE